MSENRNIGSVRTLWKHLETLHIAVADRTAGSFQQHRRLACAGLPGFNAELLNPRINSIQIHTHAYCIPIGSIAVHDALFSLERLEL